MTAAQQSVVLSIGSNQGDRVANLAAAVAGLRDLPGFQLDKVSSVHQTAPWGGVEQDDFVNIVATGRTTLASVELLRACLAIEAANGRERLVRWGPRTLDIDLITLGDVVVETDELQLPHPRAHQRAFVLVPWHEVAPDATVPGRGRVADLLADLDGSDVVLRPDLTADLQEATR